jgi:hypothetical protein
MWKITNKKGSKLVPYGGTQLGDGCIDWIHGNRTNQCGGSYGVAVPDADIHCGVYGGDLPQMAAIY